MPTHNRITQQRVLVIVFMLAVILRLGYGVAKYRNVLGVSGASFIEIWDLDGLEHVLIAKSIIERKGYVVASDVDLTGKLVRLAGREALFKAPLYQFLLAGIFSLSGFSFALFFPLQVLLGGTTAILIAKIAMQAFENSSQVGLYAGLAAAAHPVLVNTASQPSNESFFFFLFFLSVLSFFWWMRSPTWVRAIMFGVIAGLTTLARESMVAPFLVMVVLGVLNCWRARGVSSIGGAAAMLGAAVLTIAPWTVHNYQQYGVFLPVSSITGTALSLGNNECVADEGLFVPFNGEGRCLPLDSQRFALLKDMPNHPFAFWNDRAYAKLAREFILQHPAYYLQLCVRRAWTTFLPYHPLQNLDAGKKLILGTYFVLVIVIGLGSIFVGALRGLSPFAKVLLWVAAASYAPLVAVYVTADLRYRVGIDLIFGCFAGFGCALVAGRGLFPAGRRKQEGSVEG